jgi:hypothetical protein
VKKILVLVKLFPDAGPLCAFDGGLEVKDESEKPEVKDGSERQEVTAGRTEVKAGRKEGKEDREGSDGRM